MRFQDALLLQKQQAEQTERQHEAQVRLEKVASQINAHFDYWCQFRDPFEESRRRIQQPAPNRGNEQLVLSSEGSNKKSGSVPSSSPDSAPKGTSDIMGKHADDNADLNSTAFNLYRKLKFGS